MPYFVEFGGPVSSFGTDINGYLAVGFQGYSSEKVNESLIDEIYQVIDVRCKQEGINDVPVIFEFAGYITLDEAEDTPSPDEEMITVMDEDGNYAIKDNGTTQKTNETTNQTPSFTSIMAVLGLLSLLIIKRS